MQDQTDELERCKADPVHFIETYCYSQDKNTGHIGPLKLLPHQRQLFESLEQGHFTLLKFRDSYSRRARQMLSVIPIRTPDP